MTRSPNRRKLSRDQHNRQTITRQISQSSRRVTLFVASLPAARQSLIPQYSYRLHLGPCNIFCQFCGAFHWIQERSYRSTIESPLFFNCCQRGQILLPSFPNAPEPLKSLLQDHTDVAKAFRSNIRNYNNAFAFSSLGANIDHSVYGPSGVYTFRVHGELVHRIGSLLPISDDQRPCFSQIYIYDSDPRRQAEIRMSYHHGLLDLSTVLQLQHMLQLYNPYIDIFMTAKERLAINENISLHLKTVDVRHFDRHRYNRPIASEVAIIMPGTGEEQVDKRDIILETRSRQLKRISELHSAYCALRYPLLFPNGQQGWHPNFHSNDNRSSNSISQRDYYSYHLHHRSGSFLKILHHAGRLFQEFIVDAYAQIEQNRLSYFRFNQTKLRADLYQGIMDAIADGRDLSNVGTRTILPATFTGGPREMRQQYHDAMAIVRAHSKPDIFITMTCNPHWPEITAELRPHHSPQDRTDIIARVFKLKLDVLLNDLIENEVLGKTVAHTYVIEFQKRGLPHAHILLIVRDSDKPRTPEHVDTIISAEIPNKTQHPELYETVINCMLHGPCGPLSKDASCMNNGKCSKKYPKDYSEQTILTSDGYPKYRRRDDGVFVIKGGHRYTNRHVIPYNSYLSAKYNCHINIEVANGILAVKYLYKYVYKGHDRMFISVERDDDAAIDEIREYLDGRYVSACEACWRIFGFSLHHHYPSVQRLQLHLENQQYITFDPDIHTIEQLSQQSNSFKTTLTEFFESCDHYPNLAGDLLYADFPIKFTWNKKDRVWRPRKSGVSIGRVYFAVPSEGERYYLRMLLYTVRGPKSFKDLRTYNGIVYSTYKEACTVRGLLESDDEWDICLTEASSFQTGHQFRQLFATILLYNNLTDPLALFNRFSSQLSDDCRHRLQTRFDVLSPTDQQIIDLALQDIRILLQQGNKSLADFNLPDSNIRFDQLDAIPMIIAEEMNYDISELRSRFQRDYEQANEDQKHIFDSIMTAIDDHDGGVFFIDGPGGTGKTFIENLILSAVRSTGQIALAVASSGIASILLNGGRTAHSRFKIPFDVFEDSICDIKAQTALAELIRQTVLIIWDEAPTQNRHCFEAVDRTLKDICGSDRWFGGIVTLLSGNLTSIDSHESGDFRQCLPVIPHASRSQIIASTISNASFWKHVTIFHLTMNMRLSLQCNDRFEDSMKYSLHAQRFAAWLLQVGEGKINEGSKVILPSGISSLKLFKLNSDLCLPLSDSPIDQIIDKVYDGIEAIENLPEFMQQDYFGERAILSPLNCDVDELNDRCISRLSGISKTFLSIDVAINETEYHDYSVPKEYLNTINLSGLPRHSIIIKLGCPIILLRNLDRSAGLCNGTRLIVVAFAERVIQARILSGIHRGKYAFIPRISISTTASSGLPFTLRRHQFPFQVAFGMSINKSQGQSLLHIGIYLHTPVFAHGQLYVALSRATDHRNIYISLSSHDIIRQTDNIVYSEVLQST